MKIQSWRFAGWSDEVALYGVFLSLTHLLTAFFWNNFRWADSYCWGFWSGCQPFQQSLQGSFTPVLLVYGALSVVAAVLFGCGQTRWGRLIFAVLSLLKLVVHLSDYRFMGNYHYMSHLINFSFLLVKDPRDIIRLELVLFYFAAGVLKFDSEWLSGLTLPRDVWAGGAALELLLIMVVLLETVLVFALLRKRDRFFNAVLIGLAGFHLFSWHIVGFFYPILMGLLLSAFLIFRAPFRWPRQPLFWGGVLIFLLCQAWPLFFEAMPGISGRGRILSLNMFDARSVCETHLFIKFADRTIEYVPNFERHGPRIQCDPLMALRKVERTCEDQKHLPGFMDIDFDMQMRKSSDPEKTVQLSFANVCQRPLRYSFLGELWQP